MKKIVALFVVCCLLIVPMITPVSAASSSGNGYHTIDITYNGKAYIVTLATNYSTTAGARMILSSKAAITYNFSMQVKYDTVNYGYLIYQGGPYSGQLTPNQEPQNNQTIYYYTPYISCQGGMEQVIKYFYIDGAGTISADSQYSIHARAWN